MDHYFKTAISEKAASAYLAFERIVVPKLAFGDVQVSDAWRQPICFFILSTNPNILVQNTHTKTFEVPKLAIGNNSTLE